MIKPLVDNNCADIISVDDNCNNWFLYFMLYSLIRFWVDSNYADNISVDVKISY